ncbi:uncharacterized protein HGUI_01495 [Hanseniaspora guilliermondii]|uniref:Peptidase S8/S53 domain-containing protein n=1 Tax=Hanseniaspora guilliermondii TaxID=56406 RepID=A0A1L0CWT5_9ASCO|nr:uncharacterized protein HGUI_01495 [Hanseniaspora guilliermondii]
MVSVNYIKFFYLLLLVCKRVTSLPISNSIPSEYLIRLKIPDTISHLFKHDSDIKSLSSEKINISFKQFINSNFWKNNIFNSIDVSQLHNFNININSVNNTNNDIVNNTDLIQDHFEKLLELQKVLTEIEIERYIHFNGFEAIKAHLTPAELNELRLNPFIADIDSNDQFQAFEYMEMDEYFIQDNAPRHLARLSSRQRLEQDEQKYIFHKDTLGNDVHVYVLDTGIALEHPDLEGRAEHGASFVDEGPGDHNGHGTHVSGIIGSKKFGVCKDCQLIEVKCLNSKGQGDLTTVISAIEFAVEDMLQRGNQGKSVANLSLGSFRSRILNEAVKAAVDNGLVMVVAAGNNNMNACMNSPASEPSAITVGAIDDTKDQIASFSNWGECVDLFASGVRVESLSFRSFDDSIRFSGTSMATPVVAGLAAILLDSGIKSTQVKDKLIEMSTKDAMKRRHLIARPRTPNRVVFNGVDESIANNLNNITDQDTLEGDYLDEMLLTEELHISDVPIQESLNNYKRDNIYEPSFETLQELLL